MKFLHPEEKEIASKIAYYREQAMNASLTGNRILAECWRLAADAAKNFRRQNLPNKILTPSALPLIENVTYVTQILQEAPRKLLTDQQEITPPQGTFTTDDSKEAASHYRYWSARSQVSLFTSLKQNRTQASAAASNYELTEPKVACFAQEAATCFKYAQEHQESKKNDMVSHHWKTAAYEAVHLANIHLSTPKATEPELILLQAEAISLAERSLILRRKAAEATQERNEIRATQYTLAAYAAGNAAADKIKFIEVFLSEKKEEAPYWKESSEASEKAMKYRITAMAVEKTKSSTPEDYWKAAIFYAENAADYRKKALKTYSYQDPMPLKNWKEAAHAAELAAASWARTAQSAMTWNAFGITTAYWLKVTRRAERVAKEKVLKIFMSRVTFCLPIKWQPTPEQKALWQEGTVSSHFTHHESIDPNTWLYQTWLLLHKAGISCSFSETLPTQGIAISLSKAFHPLFGKDRKPSTVFLVNVAIATRPSLGMSLHLLHNRAYAQLFPNSTFIPPWPQPDLLPRDPARGNRFENVFFFGNVDNLAPQLQTQEYQHRLLQELGISFHLREESRWNDYSDVDCVVAIRDFSKSRHFDKPATKLSNAWQSGVPFIGGTDSAYAAEGHPNKDYLVARSLEELFQHLKRLKEDEAFRFKIIKNGLRSGEKFSREVISQQWKILIEETLPNIAVKWQQASIRKKRWFLIIQRIAYFADRYLR